MAKITFTIPSVLNSGGVSEKKLNLDVSDLTDCVYPQYPLSRTLSAGLLNHLEYSRSLINAATLTEKIQSSGDGLKSALLMVNEKSRYFLQYPGGEEMSVKRNGLGYSRQDNFDGFGHLDCPYNRKYWRMHTFYGTCRH